MAISRLMFVSVSSDSPASAEEAFALISSVITLDINSNPVAEFRGVVRDLSDASKPFARKYGFPREWSAMLKRLNRGDDLHGDDPDVVELGKLIKKAGRTFRADPRLDLDMANFIYACARVMEKESMTAWAHIEKNIGLTQNMRLIQVYTPDDDGEEAAPASVGAKAASHDIKPIYKKITGKEPTHGYFLSPTKRRAWAEENPELVSKHSALAKIIDAEVKKRVLKFVRASGNRIVTVDAVSKHLDKLGLLHNLPRGLTGAKLDEQMNFYTAENRMLASKPMGLVKMNPKYDPAQDNTYVAYNVEYGVDENGKQHSSGCLRTFEMNTRNKKKRHAIANEFIENEDKIRAKWMRDMKKKGTKEQVMAAMVELLHATSSRIGGKDNQTKGEPTYGLTTLQLDHVKIDGNFLRFDYTGKKLSKTSASYSLVTPEGKLIKEIMGKLIDRADEDEPVFQFRGAAILPQHINKYIKTLGTAASAHTFRRVSGTKMAMLLIKNSPFIAKAKKGEVKQREVDKWLQEELKKVGEILNHRNGEKVTGNTAIKSYIDPDILVNFYNSLGLRIPNFVPLDKQSRMNLNEGSVSKKYASQPDRDEDEDDVPAPVVKKPVVQKNKKPVIVKPKPAKKPKVVDLHDDWED